MKFFLMIPMVCLMFIGCSNKNENLINLDPYTTTTARNYDKGSVYIGDILFSSANRNFVAKIISSDGSISQTLQTSVPVEVWFRQALKVELNAIGVIPTNTVQIADFVVDLDIKNLYSDLDYFSKENLKANGEVIVKIVSKKHTITKRISQNQSKFSITANKDELQAYTKELLEDLVKKTAREIANSI